MSKLLISLVLSIAALCGCSTYTVIPQGMTAAEAERILAARKEAAKTAPTVIFVSVPQPPVYYAPGCYPYYCGIPFGFNLNLQYQYHRYNYRR